VLAIQHCKSGLSNQGIRICSDGEILSLSSLVKEKRLQDWSLEEKLNMVITCAPKLNI
jgi:hypothetical protein